MRRRRGWPACWAAEPSGAAAPTGLPALPSLRRPRPSPRWPGRCSARRSSPRSPARRPSSAPGPWLAARAARGERRAAPLPRRRPGRARRRPAQRAVPRRRDRRRGGGLRRRRVRPRAGPGDPGTRARPRRRTRRTRCSRTRSTRIAAAVRLSGRTGCSLAAVAGAVEDDLRARHRQRLELRAATAAPRASAALLAGLPVLGLAMGSGVGADPWGVLTGTGRRPGRCSSRGRAGGRRAGLVPPAGRAGAPMSAAALRAGGRAPAVAAGAPPSAGRPAAAAGSRRSAGAGAVPAPQPAPAAGRRRGAGRRAADRRRCRPRRRRSRSRSAANGCCGRSVPDDERGRAGRRCAGTCPGACDLLGVCLAAGRAGGRRARPPSGTPCPDRSVPQLRTVAALYRLGAEPRRAWADVPGRAGRPWGGCWSVPGSPVPRSCPRCGPSRPTAGRRPGLRRRGRRPPRRRLGAGAAGRVLPPGVRLPGRRAAGPRHRRRRLPLTAVSTGRRPLHRSAGAPGPAAPAPGGSGHGPASGPRPRRRRMTSTPTAHVRPTGPRRHRRPAAASPGGGPPSAPRRRRA